jgi:hypothetical protein
VCVCVCVCWPMHAECVNTQIATPQHLHRHVKTHRSPPLMTSPPLASGENQERLFGAGACGLIARALRKHPKDMEVVVHVAGAIWCVRACGWVCVWMIRM